MAKTPLTPAKKPLQTRYQEDPTTTSVLVMPIYFTPPKINKKEHRKSKFLVYFLTLFVILCFALLVFASVVLRIKKPTLRIDSVSLKSLKYDYSPQFNIALFVKISILNRNFGHFEFDDPTNSTVLNLVYGNASTVVGRSELKFKSGRVDSRGREKVGIEIVVSSSLNVGLNLNDTFRVHEDLNSGTLEFLGLAKLKGKVHLLKKLQLSTFATMNCTFQIDLVHPSVKRLQC